MQQATTNENIEIQLLLQAIYMKYGYDFRNYSKASIKRRILQSLSRSELTTISEMQHRVLYDEQFFSSLLMNLSINVTEMFREPLFFRTIREKIIPILKKEPFIKVWHAGCATGEEVYSMAILLKEDGMYERAQIYATDFNQNVIQKAKDGIYPISSMKEYTKNYKIAGGRSSFADYYTARYDHAIMEKSLKKNIVFADHNLATDWVFGEMNVIFCRNVLIYFTRELQDRAIRLFRDSLGDGGFLCLGSKESIRFSEYSNDFEDAALGEKIYRKKKGMKIED